MKNIFKLKIDNVDDITITVDSCCVDFPIEVSFETLNLIDRFWTAEDAYYRKNEIMKFYNEELWNDPVLLNLMVRYIHHIKSYNDEGWTRRGDFNTPELYKAFITGLEVSIRGYITEKMNNKFVPGRDYSVAHLNYVKDYIESEG